ncbi:MAG: hypothetical protein WBB07_29790 [Mycobacterium sp.]
MTTNDDFLIDAEYQGVELGTRHANLAVLVARAAQWARAFCTPISDSDHTGYDVDVDYPLMSHAVALEGLHARLGAAMAELVTSMAPSPDIRMHTPAAGSEARVLGSPVTHFDGAVFVVGLEPQSRYRVTHQAIWCESIGYARAFLASAQTSTVELSWYAVAVQELLDQAFATVRDAYADAVAATYGGLFAALAGPGMSSVLISCMQELTRAGFDDSHCEPVLSRLEANFPVSVAKCRARQDKWQPTSIAVNQ